MITVSADSVGGHKCFILYRAGKPIATVWSPDPGKRDWTWTSKDFSPEQLMELAQLLETMMELHLTHAEMQNAVTVYLSERNKET